MLRRARLLPPPPAMVALGVAAGFFGGQATAWWKQDAYDWRLQVLLPLCAAGVIALIVVVTAVGGRRIVKGKVVPAAFVVGAAAVGLFLAAPVGVQWNDGCRGHDGRVPLLTAPVAALATPEKRRVSYDELVHANACIDVLPRNLPPDRRRAQPG